MFIQSMIDADEYGEVYNSDLTYKGIAHILDKHGSTVIGWTDEEGGHFDIWMTVQAIQAGHLQGGLHARTDLFVAVMRHGAFGFEISKDRPELYPDYVAEKLNMGGGVTTDKLTELISGVLKELA